MTDPGGKVEVAVALPVAGTFHYRVGPKWRDDMAPGRRVLVPFGNRRVTGYVLGRAGDEAPEAPPLPRELKEIIQPLDDEPLFGPEMTPFFRFTAWYYHHPIGLVIAEALPTGLKVMSHRTAHLTPDGQAALDQSETDPDEARLLGRLKKGRGQPLTRLAQDHPAGLVRSLVERGWVRVDDQLSRDRVALRTETWVHLEPARTDLSFRLGSREKEILGRLRNQSPLCASDLAGDGPTITPILQRLEKKNWVRLEPRPVYRDDLGRSLDFGPEEPTATPAQEQAIKALVQALEDGAYSPFLLYGVTGSGKTLVYLAAAREALRRSRGVLWLVPEISLAPALEGLLRVRLDQDVAVLHSGLPPAERYDQWMKIRRGLARVAIGARSGVFAPIDNLGLVVVDEEHDGAYKQEDGLRYHARDLAVLRARQTGAVVVLGSATPAMETYGGAQSGRYRLLTLAERVGAGRLPKVDVVDMRYDTGRRRPPLTPILKEALADALKRKGQALLFINRRGTASLPICLSCGHVIHCTNCSVTLTLHRPGETKTEDGRLVCHQCGFELPPAQRCPSCQSPLFRYMGVGTEALEREVMKAFPEARVGRLDADTARHRGELTRILTRLKDRDLDVLVGTQMVTKGHDFPGITLVGVIDADLGLHRADFRAAERTFQLLTQVAGRAGRGEDPGRVIVQTFCPDHYTMLLAKQQDYPAFYAEEIRQRREAGYPPFTRLALLRLQGTGEEETLSAAETAAEAGRNRLAAGGFGSIDLLGPAPAPIFKIKTKYRFQILARGDQVGSLQAFLKAWSEDLRSGLQGTGVAWGLDVDPHQMT